MDIIINGEIIIDLVIMNGVIRQVHLLMHADIDHEADIIERLS